MFISVSFENGEMGSGMPVGAKMYGKLVLEGHEVEDVVLSNEERRRLKIP